MAMNKMIGWTMAAMLAIGVAAAQAQERGPRIVLVHLDRVFNEFYKTKLAGAQIETRKNEIREELKTRESEMQTLNKEIAELRGQVMDTALADEYRAQLRETASNKQMKLNELQQQFQQFAEIRNKELEDMSRRMRRGLIDEIREAVREFARSQGYDLVLDASGQTLYGIESIVYFDEKLDITPRVIEALNRGAQ